MVQVIVLFSVWKFRMRPGEENLDGPPIHGNTRLEVIWTAIPAILLVGLCTYAFVVLEDIEAAEPNTLEVRVVGEQFTWSFFYDRDGEEVMSPELHLPLDRPVQFTLQSKDVIHDFFVPAFRMKKDAVPGIDVTYRVTPNRIGQYPIVCAELCGLGHATMRQTAVVESEEDFTAWLARVGQEEQGGGGGGGGGGANADGKQIFTSNGCGGCHTLADAQTNATVGPDLDEGLADKDEAYIRESIVDPSADVVDGYSDSMPKTYGTALNASQLDSLVQYLSEVTRGG
jgi:cytochrome c oxidase subunit 2